MSSLRKQRKASIVITVLILMVVSSFLVLLTMRYVLSMLSWFTSLTNYYKSYYIARGGMDVLLTQHSYRGWWYETALASSWNTFQCGSSCSMHGDITSRFERVDSSSHPSDATCSKDTALTILPGQSAIYALFSDDYQLSSYFVPLQALIDYKSFASLKDIDMYVYDNPSEWNLYWYDSRDGVFWKTYLFDTISTFATIPDTNSDKVKHNLFAVVPNTVWLFLIVNNPNTNDDPAAKPFRYCFSAKNKNIIWQTSIIRSSASVYDTDVTLETVKTNRFPSILVQ